MSNGFSGDVSNGWVCFCETKKNVSKNVMSLCSGLLLVAEVLGRFRKVHYGLEQRKTCPL